MTVPPRLLHTLFVATLFLVIASPTVFALVDKTLGRPILRQRLTENGVPTRLGLVIHAVVFALLYYFFLSLK
jgi:hypothetical protein